MYRWAFDLGEASIGWAPSCLQNRCGTSSCLTPGRLLIVPAHGNRPPLLKLFTQSLCFVLRVHA